MATSNGQYFPKDVKIRDGRTATLRLMGANDKARMLDFARALPQDDLLFLRTDITDPQIIEDWIKNLEKGTTITTIAEIHGDLAAYASLHLNEARWTRRGIPRRRRMVRIEHRPLADLEETVANWSAGRWRHLRRSSP